MRGGGADVWEAFAAIQTHVCMGCNDYNAMRRLTARLNPGALQFVRAPQNGRDRKCKNIAAA